MKKYVFDLEDENLRLEIIEDIFKTIPQVNVECSDKNMKCKVVYGKNKKDQEFWCLIPVDNFEIKEVNVTDE